MPSRTDQNWRHGAVMLDPQHTRFALWAPDAQSVSVEFENGPAQALQPEQDGWFVLEAECGAGTRYRYNVALDADNTLTVPDPASRAQDGDVHGYSIVVDQTAYQWQNTGWQGRPWHEAVIYELHVGALDGYEGVEKRLQHLVDTGITAIELMPIAQFPGIATGAMTGYCPMPRSRPTARPTSSST